MCIVVNRVVIGSFYCWIGIYLNGMNGRRNRGIVIFNEGYLIVFCIICSEIRYCYIVIWLCVYWLGWGILDIGCIGYYWCGEG